MAAPAIVPIIKKVATVVLSDKKGRKVVIGIVLGVIVIVMMPIIAVLGIFNGTFDMNTDRLQAMIRENNSEASTYMTTIEDKMAEAGYSAMIIEEAQVLYTHALFDKTDDEDFVNKLIACYSLEEQTDEDLIAKVNETFNTDIPASEYTAAVKTIREKYQTEETG